ncbi:hypothetical protein CEXT_242911 [Caerostris extrusa]|uniref:Uncharacterized protein n=1 Tax=Caerostris extrusa TaxID=172846 RepID=A0AAV4P614_CAEEX|nr:hypothetical protein CEXT_242911 [Caerostris extrusa]
MCRNFPKRLGSCLPEGKEEREGVGRKRGRIRDVRIGGSPANCHGRPNSGAVVEIGEFIFGSTCVPKAIVCQVLRKKGFIGKILFEIVCRLFSR